MSKLDQRSEARLCELYGKKEEAAHMRGSLLVSVTSVVRRPRCALLTQTQSLNDSTVAGNVALLQVVEE